MVNDFVYSVRSLDLMFGLLNNERKGTQKYAHMQMSEHIFFEKENNPLLSNMQFSL